MRFAFAILAALAAGSAFGSGTAQADGYKWCAEYGFGNGGSNCGFVTLRQCRAAISGDNRAACVINPHYDGRWYPPGIIVYR